MVWSWSIFFFATSDEILLDLVTNVYTHDGMMDLGMYIDGSIDPLMKPFLKHLIIVITYIVLELPYSIFQIPIHFSASSPTYEMLR